MMSYPHRLGQFDRSVTRMRRLAKQIIIAQPPPEARDVQLPELPPPMPEAPAEPEVWYEGRPAEPPALEPLPEPKKAAVPLLLVAGLAVGFLLMGKRR